MKSLAWLIFAGAISAPVVAATKAVVIDGTAEIAKRSAPDAVQAGEIHINTYTLEKGVAYFADNLTGERQALAREIAAVVEDIHVASERGRLDELAAHIDKYQGLIDRFLPGL